MAAKTFTRAEVGQHNSPDDLWIIIDHQVYDVSEFLDAHPGGNVVLQEVAGKDATKDFYNLHRHEVLRKYVSLRIGTVAGERPEVADMAPGALSGVPYAEPLWLRPEFRSPYYSDSHRRLQKAFRRFVDEVITPEAQQKEADGTYISQGLIDKMAAANVLGMRLGPGPHLKGLLLLGGVMRGDDFDYFHDLIVAQEMSRSNARGFQDGNLAGLVISLTAVRNWLPNNVPLRERVTRECMSGEKKICLAISEAFAGSDVAGMRTTAEKTPDGKHYVINGTKKWITNGVFSDYFVTACRTKKGFNMILVPRQEGVETTLIKTSYSSTAGTAFVQYDNVKVPVDHLMGEEDKGFQVIMSNFNHERFGMTCGTIRKCRTVVEECLKWSNQRIIFGKRLIDQPVIRQK
jgi:alkylation response protein AidB-like acyl-CoA dehydrogenase